MIVRSAALATGCSTAIFLRPVNEDPKVLAHVGEAVAIADVVAALAHHMTESPDRILMVDDVRNAPTCDAWIFIPRGFRFLCAVEVVDEAGLTQGTLLILEELPRPGLSAAQQYVLRTYAAQLAMVLDLDALRKQVRLRTGSVATERLRLLESVVVNANDAVLITEAEPIDLPGPRIVYCNRAFERTTG